MFLDVCAHRFVFKITWEISNVIGNQDIYGNAWVRFLFIYSNKLLFLVMNILLCYYGCRNYDNAECDTPFMVSCISMNNNTFCDDCLKWRKCIERLGHHKTVQGHFNDYLPINILHNFTMQRQLIFRYFHASLVYCFIVGKVNHKFLLWHNLILKNYVALNETER